MANPAAELRVLVFGASFRKESLNRALAALAVRLVGDRVGPIPT